MNETFEEMALRVASYELHDDSSKLVIIEFATRIRDELAKGQEPVGYYYRYADGLHTQLCNGIDPSEVIPLYLHPSPIPADMVLVPREPTKAMIFAGSNAWCKDKSVYKAMIAAYEKEQKP